MPYKRISPYYQYQPKERYSQNLPEKKLGAEIFLKFQGMTRLKNLQQTKTGIKKLAAENFNPIKFQILKPSMDTTFLLTKGLEEI